jgi:hypothetical protein
MNDLESKDAMLCIAQDYERLAKTAELRASGTCTKLDETLGGHMDIYTVLLLVILTFGSGFVLKFANRLKAAFDGGSQIAPHHPTARRACATWARSSRPPQWGGLSLLMCGCAPRLRQ